MSEDMRMSVTITYKNKIYTAQDALTEESTSCYKKDQILYKAIINTLDSLVQKVITQEDIL